MIYKLHLNHEPWLYAILAEMCFILIFILIDSPQSRQTPPWRCPDLLSALTFSHDGVLIWRPEGGIGLKRNSHESFCVSPPTLPIKRTLLCSAVNLLSVAGWSRGLLGSQVDIQPFITPNIVPPDCNHMSWPCLSWILRLRGLFSELPPLSDGRMHRIFHSGCTAIPIHFQQKIAGSLQCNPDEAG